MCRIWYRTKEIKNEIQQAVINADEKQINGTPTVIVGMNSFVGSKPYPEVKQIIINMGGKLKQTEDEQ